MKAMDALPAEYVEHNLPLVLLSGLGTSDSSAQNENIAKAQRNGVRIVMESPELRSERSSLLKQELLKLDGTHHAWNSTALPISSGVTRYAIKAIGRSYVLPARKAAPLPQSPGAEGGLSSRNPELHSPLSPLSPGSPVFPDGIFTPLWVRKHQRQVPALLLAFFSISADNTRTGDDQLKADINSVRNSIARSGFKVRVAAVLLSERSILQSPDLEERLSGIRRATALDSKSGLFFMPPMSSQAETAAFVHSMMTVLQPSCIEYYRDLTKHARRKKARGGPFPLVSSGIVGMSQSTSTSGWNARYEFKQGVFAEFRQEMDAAERHYGAVIEELFSSEGAFETIASWSPRWDEARLLSDSTALRILRCQLWIGPATSAAQFWQNYRVRMRSLIDRRGKGSSTYGWEAWEARWAGIMAQLIQAAEIPDLRKPSSTGRESSQEMSLPNVFAQPEKLGMYADRGVPFDLLHHPGYWLRMFASKIRARWDKAVTIPDEDRISPGKSPASKVANRSQVYDTYLVPHPHEENPISGSGVYDYASELGTVVHQAADEFDARSQTRMSEQLRFELATDFARAGQFEKASHTLSQLWDESSWRDEYWHGPFAQVVQLLLRCISCNKTVENSAIVPALIWELLRVAPAIGAGDDIDLLGCLDGWNSGPKVLIQLDDRQRLSPILPQFTFKNAQGHVGEALDCQLVLSYKTSSSPTPLRISKVECLLGGLNSIIVQHSDEAPYDATQKQSYSALIDTHPSENTFGAVANLTFTPNQTRVFGIPLVLREAQLLEIRELVVTVESATFALTHTTSGLTLRSAPQWFIEQDGEVDSIPLPRQDSRSINLLPKPPKLQVKVHDTRKTHYTEERVHLTIDFVNEETESVSGTLETRANTETGLSLNLEWTDGEGDHLARKLSSLGPGSSERLELVLHGPADAGVCLLELEVAYKLASDTTALTKSVSLELEFVEPLRAKFSLTPLLHPAPWPSYFAPFAENGDTTASGLAQLWSLEAEVHSRVVDVITLDNLAIMVDNTGPDTICEVASTSHNLPQPLDPNQSRVYQFQLTTRKRSLDDRRPSHLHLAFQATWSFPGPSSEHTTNRIPIPRLSIPTSEPRVLCTVQEPTNDSPTHTAPDPFITLQYHLENPSIHFLTFALTMAASDEFAFSGPKSQTLSLAPLSRHHVSFRLLPHLRPSSEATYSSSSSATDDAPARWISPALAIVDSYYQKSLNVHPAGPRVRLDENRVLQVWTGRDVKPSS